MDDTNTSTNRPAGLRYRIWALYFSIALFVAWFVLNVAHSNNVREWTRLWHAKFPTMQDWLKESEPVRWAGWQLAAVMDVLNTIAGLLVFGGIILILCTKRPAGMTAVRTIGVWLALTSPALLMVVGSVWGIAEHWPRIHERRDGKNPEMTLNLALGMHAVGWSLALLLGSLGAWFLWQWGRAMVVSVFSFLTAMVLGVWGLNSLLRVLLRALPRSELL